MTIYADALAKSEDFVGEGQDVSLAGHSKAVYEIVSDLLNRAELKEDYNEEKFNVEQKEKIIKVAAYLHDVGKKNEQFQMLLRNESQNYIKHETKTLDYKDYIRDNWDLILNDLDIDLEFSDKVLEDVLAFIVSHHGLFFLSKSKDNNYDIKKNWTEFSLKEKSRITLTDLLFDYYPAGGFIVLADLVHSYSLAKGINYKKQIKKLNDSKSISKFVEDYFNTNMLKSEKQKENRMIDNLKDIIKLTLGGVKI